MLNDNSTPRITLSGTINNICTECGHRFVTGDSILISSALFKVVDGRLVFDDHAPEIICFPPDDDGHYAGK
jgi:hypothetical protein